MVVISEGERIRRYNNFIVIRILHGCLTHLAFEGARMSQSVHMIADFALKKLQ